ncbi:heavy metal-associated isoprenylated plant protein 47-like [Apium graveolens]|uniref:heavy metal-associated isoprenylated plant protein 47-like n=1 Tax=Apium graveolens TaxID=4045 RepID=UPI003D7B46A6
MLQRIIVKVSIKKDKDRSKAMKIAVGATGVISVKIGGDDKNIVTVIGNEVDAVSLTQSLVKKFGSATLVRVEQVVKVYGFDQDQFRGASMIYEGQPADNYRNNYSQPMSFYNSPVVQYPPQYYYPCERPGESGCSIM